MHRRPPLKRARPAANSAHKGNGHDLTTCPSFDRVCQPRFIALEQAARDREIEGGQITSTLGLLLQSQERTSAQFATFADSLAKVDRVLRLVCQAHDLDPEVVGE
jgi:hypothetical protein